MPDAPDAERESKVDTTPAADEESADGARAATTSSPGGGIGEMAVQKKAAEVGAADAPEEKEADATAQRIMRMGETPKAAPEAGAAPETPKPDAAAGGGAAPAPAGGAAAGGGASPGQNVVQRRVDTSNEAARSTDASDPHAGALPDNVQAYLESSKGGGQPLPEAARRFFEERFGEDFGAVRIHDDPAANDAARAIGAQAFTRNTDIYFATGAYDPVTATGREVIAHELAHVVQQRGGAGGAGGGGGAAGAGGAPGGGGEEASPEKNAVTPEPPGAIRRKNGKGKTESDKKKEEAAGRKSSVVETTKTKGKIDLTSSPGTMEIGSLPVPGIKVKLIKEKPVKIRKGSEKRDTKQVDVWEQSVAEAVKTNLSNRLDKAPKKNKGKDSNTENRGPIWYVRHEKNKQLFIGSVDHIAAAIRRPRWKKADGVYQRFDVDHKLEYQLSGHDTSPEDNLWLLEDKANRSAGSQINNSINAAIKEIIDEARPKLDKKPPSPAKARERMTITALDVKSSGAPETAPSWSKDEMSKPALTKDLDLVPNSELEELKGKPDRIVIYRHKAGGSHADIDPAKGVKRKDFEILPPIQVTQGKGGTANVKVFKGHERVKGGTYPVTIAPIEGVDYGGYIQAEQALKGMVFNGLSPLDVVEVEVDPLKGLVGKAKIPKPSIKMLENVEIGVRFDGDDVAAYAQVDAGALKLPGPFQITGGGLDISAGNKGIGVEGAVFFEIEKFAKGKLGGRGGQGESFALFGELEFDTDMFTEAKLKVSYRDGKWGVEGTLAIGEGKVSGIKKAKVNVKVDDEIVSATGSFESSLKGLQEGELSFLYDPAKGMEVAGKLKLGALPGIRGGTVDAKLTQSKTGQGYSVSGGVTAEPAIPGVTGSITGRYDDGAFLAEANLGYQKGMLKGQVKLGLTNQAIVDNKPSGGPTDKMTAYGAGQVTIRIAPWLQGTVGLRLDPNGQMTVMGEVSLPSSLEIFPEKKIDKNIFKIGIDIPIVGVAVLGQRIGIFAFIEGGLDAGAGIGPGQLRALSLGVTYNPEREAETAVKGRAELYVPARAGLTLFVRGGLGAGIPVVSAKAGINVSGTLGLEGAATASVEVNWNATTGLKIDAKGELFVQPKFKFSIDGFVEVEADLLFKTIELYKKTWKFAAFEYGSDLRFGVAFPVHYEEGKPFDVSLSDVQFTYPQIDTTSLLKGLIKQIA